MSQAELPGRPERGVTLLRTRPALRIMGGAALLLSEYLTLAVLYDGAQLGQLPGRWSQLDKVTNLVAIGSAVATAGLLARGRRLLDVLRRCTPMMGALDPRALLAHGLSFGAFLALTDGLFAHDELRSAHPAAWLAGWAVTGMASLASLFWLVAGGAWKPLAGASMLVLASGSLTGGLAWYLAWLLRPAWPWLVSLTLPLAARLLRLLVGPARVEARGALLGLEGFHVEVTPECSGVEGLVVITVLLLGYLILGRERLRFPNALLLLPLGAAVVFGMNIVRIGVLVMIGAWLSPEIAFGGFHSKAGWLSVCFIALAMLWAGERADFFARTLPNAERRRSPALPYCMPLFVCTALGMLTGLLTKNSVDWLYIVRILGAAAVIVRYRDELGLALRPFSVWPLLNGAAVFGLWFWLAERGAPAGTGARLMELFERPEPVRVAWCASRVVGSVCVVPIAEELAFRGYLQRRLVSADFEGVSLQRFTWLSWLGSAAAFGALHQSVLAGVAAGIAYSLAAFQRGRLADAILAHAVTNALIAVAVLGFDQWWLW